MSTRVRSVQANEILSDSEWIDAANFVVRLGANREEIIAPPGFEHLVPCVTFADKPQLSSAKVVVLRKTGLELLGIDWIKSAVKNLYPSFANSLFVIFSDRKPSSSITASPHFREFVTKFEELIRGKQPLPVAAPARMSAYLGNNRAITRTIHGHKIYVDTRDHSLTPHIILDGNWEDWITKVFRGLVREGMKVMDIGANIGWYSLIAAELMGPKGRLTAFEANPEMADILYRNIMVNGYADRATVVPKAVYSESKPLEFMVYEHYKGSSSIFSTDESAAVYNDELKHITVQSTSLDDFLPAGSTLDFIKIDAEGAEPFVFKGARRTLQENRDIIIMMEFSPTILAASYGSAHSFIEDIHGLGFDIWRIANDSSLVRSSSADLLSVPHCDVVLRRP